MTFKPIQRARAAARQPFCATPANTIRLAQQFTPITKTGVRTGAVLVIWIGKDLAPIAGLTEQSHAVELLIDADELGERMAFRVAAAGSFRASRRNQAYCIYVDAATTAQYFAERRLFTVLPPESIEIEDGMVAFRIPGGAAA